jgi:hypothetical protein
MVLRYLRLTPMAVRCVIAGEGGAIDQAMRYPRHRTEPLPRASPMTRPVLAQKGQTLTHIGLGILHGAFY